MDGYLRDGKTLLKGSNPVAEFTIGWLDEARAESLMDEVVQVLNDELHREEFTPAKYPGLYTHCPNCGQVAKTDTVSNDPITYGIWSNTGSAWMRDMNNNLCHFPSKAAARAQMRVWDEQALYANYHICVIGPDGLPAEEGK